MSRTLGNLRIFKGFCYVWVYGEKVVDGRGYREKFYGDIYNEDAGKKAGRRNCVEKISQGITNVSCKWGVIVLL